MRARGAIVVSALACAAFAACSLYEDGVGNDGTGDASVDDGGSDDGGGKHDGSTAEAGPMDAAPSDAATRFCAPGTHAICIDFDESTDPKYSFCQATGQPCDTSSASASLTLSSDALSAPRAMLTTADPADAGSAHAYATRTAPGATAPVTYAFDLKIEAAGAASSAVPLAELTIGDAKDGGRGHRVELTAAGVDDAGAAVSFVEVGADAGANGARVATLPFGAWFHAELHVMDATHASLTLTSAGGGDAGTAALTIGTTADGTTRGIALGLVSVGAPHGRWRVGFDDVTLDDR